jgi:8-oxo-dGTP pyrophosphatase MutT (NUDIX family)
MDSELIAKPAPVAVPAATILLVRDGDAGLEVFMVKRHHEMDFGGGALVFPGGKTARDDYDPALVALADGAADWSPEFRAVAAAAIREAFEEAGVLLARDATSGEIIGTERLAALDLFREELEQGRIGLLDFLRRENLRLACDQLVPFAHWITPRDMPKRFDTHFFLARAPSGHQGQHCGRESIDSLWIRPGDALAGPALWKLMFPTRMNLMKLSHTRSVADALAAARTAPPKPVEPWIEESPDGKFVRIRDDAGYDITGVPIGEMM